MNEAFNRDPNKLDDVNNLPTQKYTNAAKNFEGIINNYADNLKKEYGAYIQVRTNFDIETCFIDFTPDEISFLDSLDVTNSESKVNTKHGKSILLKILHAIIEPLSNPQQNTNSLSPDDYSLVPAILEPLMKRILEQSITNHFSTQKESRSLEKSQYLSLLLEVAPFDQLTQEQKKTLIRNEMKVAVYDSFIISISTSTTIPVYLLFFRSTNFINDFSAMYLYAVGGFFCFSPTLRFRDAIKRYKDIKLLNAMIIPIKKSPLMAGIRKMFIGDTTVIFAKSFMEKMKREREKRKEKKL